MAALPQQVLPRDRVTLAVYAMAATWGWWLYCFGPSMVLLRDEQGTSRTVASLHGTAMAVGALVAGFAGAALVRRFGRRRLLAAGCCGMVVGIAALLLGPGTFFTLPAALVVGTAGSTAFNMIAPVLATLHREASSAAISEANAIAATVGLLAPLGLGAGVSVGWGWRAAIVVSALLAAATAWVVVRAGASPSWSDRLRRPVGGTARFGVAFWACWVAVVACIAVEFATVFWASDLLVVEHGVGAGTASGAVSAFVAGMAAGRWAAVRLARRWPPATMFLAALGLAGAGWAVLWTAPHPVLAVVGLGLCGLGAAWHFPMGITLLLAAAGTHADHASSINSVGAGIASGTAPFALGALADTVGTHSAFLVVPGLLAAAAVSLLLAMRWLRLRPASSPAPV